MDKNNNPWKGIVPYTDDAEDLRKHPFAGRDCEISDLMSIVDNNAISTLYGRSGNGKTSLLKAGLFQRARNNGYYPVWIRLDVNGKDYAQQIIEKISNISRPIKLECDASLDKNTGDIHMLRNFFGYNYFFSCGDDEVTPLIVLDQFEEVLRQDDNRALFLLKQLKNTLHCGFLCDKVTPYTIAFRVLISIREDDLYLLEDVLDSNFLGELKMGRYRLRSISKDNAPKIVLVRPELWNDKNRDTIVETLMNKAFQQGQVSTMMLSLMCHWLYDHCKGDCITLEDVNNLGDNPMEQFFNEAIAKSKLNYNQRKIICRESVGSDGRRLLIDAQRMRGIFSQQQLVCLCDETSQLHIFQLSADKKHYELIHDRLAETVFTYRKNLEEEERTRRAEDENRRIRRQNDRLNRIRSLFLSEKSLQCKNNRYLAQMLALEALPQDLDYPDKPLIPEAEVALRKTLSIPFCKMDGHNNVITRVGVSSDGRFVVSLSRDGLLCLWDAHSGSKLQLRNLDNLFVSDFDVCKNCDKLVVLINDGSIKIYDLNTTMYDEDFMFLKHNAKDVNADEQYFMKDGPKAVAVSPNGLYIAVGTEAGSVYLKKEGREIMMVTQSDFFAEKIAFNPQETQMAVLGAGRLGIFKLNACEWCEWIETDKYFFSPVLYMSYSNDGKCIICGMENGEIAFVGSNSGERITSFDYEVPAYGINALSISNDAKKSVYSVSGRLTFFEHDSKLLSDFVGSDTNNTKITSVVLSHDGRFVIWGNVDGEVSMYDMKAGVQYRTIIKAASFMKTLEFGPNGDIVYCLSAHNTFRVINLNNCEIIHKVYDYKNTVGREIVSVDERLQAIYDKSRHKVDLFERDNLREPKGSFEIMGKGGELTSMAFNSSGNILALAQRNGKVKCWNTDDCEFVYELDGYSSEQNTVLFSPKGGIVATTAKNGAVNVWNEETGEIISELVSDDGSAISLAFSPDGMRLAVGMENGRINVWDMSSKKIIDTLSRNHKDGRVRCVTFSPDGESIVASYEESMVVLIWPCPSLKKLKDDIGEKIKKRAFTVEEKRRYYLDDEQ